MTCDRCNHDLKQDDGNIFKVILYGSPTSKPQPVAVPSKAAIIQVSKTVAFCVITQTPHTRAPQCLSWYSRPLIFFPPSELIIVQLMGFWNGMWWGCGTGRGHGVTPLSAVNRLWLDPSSWLNDFPGELRFWHRQTLPTVTRRCMEVTLSRRLCHGKLLRIYIARGSTLSAKEAE